MNDYSRELDPKLDATEYIKQYSNRIQVVADDQLGNHKYSSHEHMLAAQATLTAYSRELAKLLKSPKDEHEARLNALVDELETRLLGDYEPHYRPDMTVTQVVQLMASRVGHDLRAISDFLITTRLEESFK